MNPAKRSQTCSGTVVADPASPGRSNLVWTAGHCVHAGREEGWFRNIVFVPSFNDEGRSAGDPGAASPRRLAPFGTWWADWAGTSEQWIAEGTAQGGGGAPFDFAVLHVKPAPGCDGRSLEETVGAALPVAFNGPPVQDVPSLSAWGYPAAAPFDGSTMHFCSGEPGRLSLKEAEPAMYRIGCTMTGGSSGGGWSTADGEGKAVLVSNTSIGPDPAVWLAGPYLGDTAKSVLDNVSGHVAE
ncbi:trypsin-like serine peptidase [Streptomyces venezuelae]|uniref:trypsin-like serine peptidase n=1 Tax=Streptomyces venezuelae TaxID=54571 RepID=UPI0037D84D8F